MLANLDWYQLAAFKINPVYLVNLGLNVHSFSYFLMISYLIMPAFSPLLCTCRFWRSSNSLLSFTLLLFAANLFTHSFYLFFDFMSSIASSSNSIFLIQLSLWLYFFPVSPIFECYGWLFNRDVTLCGSLVFLLIFWLIRLLSDLLSSIES